MSVILTATSPVSELGSLDSLTGAGTSFVRIGGGAVSSASELRLVGAQLATFFGAVQDAPARRGSLRLTAPGTQTLAGSTAVSGGALIVNGSMS